MSEYLPVALRRMVVRRANNRCEYCRSPDTFSPAPFEIDHIFPQSQGGVSTADYLAYSCPNCNGSKSAAQIALDPQINQLVPLFNPRRELWRDHFRWSQDFLLIEALTPTGRATLNRLEMNRARNVALRGLLLPANLHPPDGE